jgi:hypothetical protein
MASSINASTTAGVVTTADTSGVLNIQTAGTTAIAIDASQAVSFTNSPTVTGGTANGVAYLNGSKVLTTGSALVFDGSNLGVGVTPSAWQTSAGSRAIQFTGSAVYGYRDTNLILAQNAYFDGSWKYYASSIPASRYNMGNGVHSWDAAAAGTAGNAITYTQVLSVDKAKSLALEGATSQTGTGITFPATQSASSDANTLDDYEEGTFTPSVTFGGGSTGITYDAVRRIGTYTKIGNKVFYFIHIELTSKGSSTGQALITGLPFTSTGTDAYVPASVFIASMASITGQIMPRSSTGSTTIDIYQVVSSSYSAISNTNFTNTTGFQVSGMFSTT